MTIDTSREAVERLLDGVTPGPWEAESGHEQQNGQMYWQVTDKHDAIMQNQFCWCRGDHAANARFIAAARDLVPALLAERDAAEAREQALLTSYDEERKALVENTSLRWRTKVALADRDAAEAEIVRLSTPPDDAEVRGWIETLAETAKAHDDAYEDSGHLMDKTLAEEARGASAFITRLSHALAAETAKREAMEEALRDVLHETGGGTRATNNAVATIVTHGSKT